MGKCIKITLMSTTYLFIDGTNLFAGQYELFGPKRYLNYELFITLLEKKINVRFDKILFYASYTPRKEHLTSKDIFFLKNEFLFYKQVRAHIKTVFFKGYRSKTSGKEKEVDVKLSVDLVGYGLLHKYDAAYLFSGDADFLQAVQFVKTYVGNIDIKLLCLSNRIMYKGLYAAPSFLIGFAMKDIPIRFRKLNETIILQKTAELCPRLG